MKSRSYPRRQGNKFGAESAVRIRLGEVSGELSARAVALGGKLEYS